MKVPLFARIFLFVAALSASASTIPFSGSGHSGQMAPGQPWIYDAFRTIADPGDSWGSPGAGKGFDQWNEATPVTGFEITFDLPTAVSIDPAAPSFGFYSYDSTGTNRYAWTPTLMNSNGVLNEVTFNDPTGDPALTNGESFYINIYFTSIGQITDSAFSGEFLSPSAPTPEPASLPLIITGIAGLAWARVRLKRSTRT
jgi:hypothetical protein